MRTVLKRILNIQKIIFLILILLFTTTACGFEPKEFADHMLYTFKELQRLESQEKPVFYDIRSEKPDSEKLTVRNIVVFAMLEDGIQKDLFSVTVNANYFGKIKLYEDDTYLYLCRDGADLPENGTTELTEDSVFYLYRGDSAPFIFQYEKSSGKVSEKEIKDGRSKIILDMFTYDNKLVFLLEKRTSKPLFFVYNSWAGSVGFLEKANPKRFNFEVVGMSTLDVNGCLVGDDYYFPALNGIYKVNLPTNEVTLCVEKNYRKYNFVQIINHNGSFIVIEQKIISEAEHIGNEYLVLCRMTEYSSDFQQVIKEKVINASIGDTLIGSDGIMLFRQDYISDSKEDITSVYCRFSDFSCEEKSYYSGYNLETLSWHYISDTGEFLLVSKEETEPSCEVVLSYKE